MQLNLVTGLIEEALYCHSPNFNERPKNVAIDMLVIHNISLPPGQFGGPEVHAFFTNQLIIEQHPYFQTLREVKVSSHLFIRRGGEICQFVPFHKRAWHAGLSSFAGRQNCNDFSIGIELEGTDTLPFTVAQYQQLALCTSLLMQAYPLITPERIVGHSDIAPSRKTDPGLAFDWDHYRTMLSQKADISR